MPFIKMFAAASLPLLLFFFSISFYLQPIQGDLTRVANLSEKSWGWNKPQPAISVHGNEDSPDAHVIVIGDSFSDKNIWQTVSQTVSGERFLTFTWHDIGKAECLQSTLFTLMARYPSVRYFVVESVERAFVGNFYGDQQDPQHCKAVVRSSVKPRNEPTLATRPRFDVDKPILDPVYAVKALMAEGASYATTAASGDGYIAPLDRSDLFSNRRSDFLLFFHEDLNKKNWTGEQLERSVRSVSQISESVNKRGVKFILAVVPDKSTVYSKYLKEPLFDTPKDVWRALASTSIRSVDLKTLFLREAQARVDFYLPNDTHLGAEGFTAMGQAIASQLKPEAER
ncbi:hypothetical protein [Variovorax sp. YR216]|uniref:alginate O-acetyltransferase AlgX-related protein n=1 Tax=Variovorax sp. YR216 TaxID=1882828 RepID=UPI00089A5399|nr:hypothetical protein [Variovorax sp. YR216]SEA15538.1 SGNH hydrolase-like domain-containing protein, acetyltransferase AlgX [Variovorax sp. YR216]